MMVSSPGILSATDMFCYRQKGSPEWDDDPCCNSDQLLTKCCLTSTLTRPSQVYAVPEGLFVEIFG
jgi:hypothetical protein